LHKLIYKSINVRGFLVSEFEDRAAEFYEKMPQWVASGKIKVFETITEAFRPRECLRQLIGARASDIEKMTWPRHFLRLSYESQTISIEPPVARASPRKTPRSSV